MTRPRAYQESPPPTGNRVTHVRSTARGASLSLLLLLSISTVAFAQPGSPAPSREAEFEIIDPFEGMVPPLPAVDFSGPGSENQWNRLGAGTNDEVRALVIWNGELHAGGRFTTAGGGAASHVARWDGAAWHPLGAGTDGPVHALVVWNGALVAGGSFASAGGSFAGNLARWDGAAWSPLGGTDGPVRALAVHGGDLAVGGEFGLVAGAVPASNVALRTPAGVWSALGSGVNGPVYALASFRGELEAGGDFNEAGGAQAVRFARWTGASWSPLFPGAPSIGFDAPVRALLPKGNALWIGGDFTEVSGVGAACIRLAKWQYPGTLVVPSQGPNGPVRALVLYFDHVVFAGDFDRVAGPRYPYFGLVNDAFRWENIRFGPNAPVHALAFQNDGVFAGGEFTQAADKAALHVGRWACDKPAKPTNVAASSDRCGEIRVTWSDRVIETGYRVYRDGALAATLAKDVTLFDDPGIPPGASHDYEVEAFNRCGSSELSAAATGSSSPLPGAPTGVAATTSLCNRVRVTWNDQADEVGYQIYMNGTLIGRASANETSWESPIPPGTHSFQVTTIDECGEGERSAAANGSSRRPPARPATLTASNDDCFEVDLAWSAVPGISNYRILRGGGVLVTLPSTVTAYTDAPPQGTHTYEVQSGNSCGWSESRTAAGTATPPAPSPSTVSASDTSCAEIYVHWSASPDADEYRLYRDGALLALLGPGVLTYVDTPPPGSYEYAVGSSDDCGESVPNKDIGKRIAAPGPPDRFTASDTSCSVVELAWSPSLDSFGGYRIHRDGELIAGLGPSAIRYTDAPLPGVYVYTIEAANPCGWSTPKTASGGVIPSELPAPETFTASRDRCGGVDLAWSGTLWATAYDLYRDGARLASLPADRRAYSDAIGPGEYAYALIARTKCGSSGEATANGSVAPANPGPVTGLAASDTSCALVRLDWTEPDGADSVRIIRDDLHLVTLPAGLRTWNDTAATGGHTYAMGARSACGWSGASTAVGRVLPGAPDSPEIFTASDSSCSVVRVDWSAAPRAEEYGLYRNNVRIATLPAGLLHYEEKIGGGAHLYELVAENGCGASNRVQTVGYVEPVPSAPSLFTASDTSCALVRLSWKSAEGADSVRVYRSGDRVGTVPAARGFYVDTPYSGGYAYEAVSVGRCGVSTASSAFGVVLPGRPKPPVDLAATTDRCDSLVVTWSDESDDESGFDVLRNGATLGVVGANVTRYADLPATGVHGYEVRAVGVCGTASGGAATGERLSPPASPALLAPSNGGAVPGGTPIVLSWTSVPGAAEYRVQVTTEGDAGFVAPLVDAVVAATSHEIPFTPPIGTYRWRAMTIAECGPGPFSAARLFTREPIEGFALSGRNVGFGYDPLGGPSGSEIPDPEPDLVVLTNDGEVGFRWGTTPSFPWIHVDPDTGFLGAGEAETLWVAALANQVGSGVFAGDVIVRTDLLSRPEDTVAVDLVVKAYPLGDCNGDGVLDERDLAALADHIVDRIPLWAPVMRLGLPDVDFDSRVGPADMDGLPPIVGNSLLHDRPEGGAGTGDRTVLWIGLGPDSFVVSLEGTGVVRAGAAKLRVPEKSAPAFSVRPLGDSEYASLVQEGNDFVLLFHNRAPAAPVLRGENRIDLAVLKWGGGPEPEIEFVWGGTAPDGADRNPMVRAEFYRLGGPGSRRFAFFPVRPNPFSRECLLSFELPAAAPVSIRVYNPAGRLVRTILYGQDHSPGVHTYTWNGRTDDGREAGDGLYFLKLESPRGTVVRRSVIVR